MISLGFEVVSIKRVDKPSFIKDNFPGNLINNQILITTYRFIEFTKKDGEEFTGYVSIDRIINEPQFFQYYLDLNNKGAYDIIN